MNILQLTTSIHSGQGASSQLSAHLVRHLRESNPGATVVHRDLAETPVPHLDADTFKAFTTAPAERSAAQKALVSLSDSLVEELRAADVIVIGLPLYNFGVPSALKAWFDHVARAGVTFRYTDKGPVGLLTGKKAYVVATRGGRYAGTPNDSQTPFVKAFLGFLGIKDVEFEYAEGLAMGDRVREQSLSSARVRLQQVDIPERLAA